MQRLRIVDMSRFPPPLIPPATIGRVSFDLCCFACGYHLRQLEIAGVCPECGRPIAQSLRNNRLVPANPAWLSRVRTGATILIVAVLAAAALEVVLFFVWLLLLPGSSWAGAYVAEYFTLAFGFGFATAWLWGGWQLTSPRGAASTLGRRRARRDSLQTGVPVLCLPPFLSTVASVVLAGDATAGCTSLSSIFTPILVVAAAGSLSIFAAAVAILVYLRRIARKELSKGFARLLLVVIVLGMAVGLAMTGVFFIGGETPAVFLGYPPLSILLGFAIHEAGEPGAGSAGPPVATSLPSIPIEVILFAVVPLLAVCWFGLFAIMLALFRRAVGAAIRAQAQAAAGPQG